MNQYKITIDENTQNKVYTDTIKYFDNQLEIESNQVLPSTVHISINKPDKYTINIKDLVESKIIIELKDSKKQKSGQLNDYTIDLILGKSSIVTLLLITDIQKYHSNVSFNSFLKSDSTLDFLASFVSNSINAKIYMNLIEPNSNLNINTITVSSDSNTQSLDFHMHHKASNTIAQMTNFAIANKKGSVVLNGVGLIDAGMKNSNDFQTLRGIIISDDASIDINPILIIDEYDVKAGHAATVGKLQEEVLFYLMSRGLSLLESQRLIINGFIYPVIDKIDDEKLKSRVEQLINERL